VRQRGWIRSVFHCVWLDLCPLGIMWVKVVHDLVAAFEVRNATVGDGADMWGVKKKNGGGSK